MTDPSLLLALHSCSDAFGMALLDPEQPGNEPFVQVHPDGRGLSNSLISRVQAILPSERWSQLQGLAVATGPGGFTGTRLTVVMARTLAQQLECPLLGVSSYALMAPRLELRLPLSKQGQPLITQEAPAGGGRWSVPDQRRAGARTQPADLAAARASPSPPLRRNWMWRRMGRLLQLLQRSHRAGVAMPWAGVLPIYPTSPVGQV